MKRLPVYDGVLRILHGLFALSVLTAFGIAKWVDDDQGLFIGHMLLGLSAGWVFMIRLVWGFWGGAAASWRSFFSSLRGLFHYLAAVSTRTVKVGAQHVPASAWGAIGMWTCLLGLIGTGILMSQGQTEQFEDFHEWFAYGLIGLAAVHVLGLALHAFQYRDQYWLSMVDGKRLLPASAENPTELKKIKSLIVLMVLFCGYGFLIYSYDSSTQTIQLGSWEWTLGEVEREDSEMWNEEDD